MKVELFDCTVDPLFNITSAARTCYQSQDKDELAKRKGFVKGIIKNKHTSPLEFGWTDWKIEGISRVCLAQLTRHRIASYCVESQRYCDTSEKESIIPVKALMVDDSCVEFVKKAQDFYKKLVKAGVPKEDARYFLPMGTTCNCRVGMNFRALRHLFELRCDPNAQWEIRELANQMKEIVIEKGWGWLVEDLING